MFCGKLQRIHDFETIAKTLATLIKKTNALQKQWHDMVWDTTTRLKDISSRIDMILDKINEREPSMLVKATSSEQEIFKTPIKIRL